MAYLSFNEEIGLLSVNGEDLWHWKPKHWIAQSCGSCDCSRKNAPYVYRKQNQDSLFYHVNVQTCFNCWHAFSLHPVSGKKRRWRKPTHFGGASRSLKVPPPKLSPYVKGAIHKLPPVKVHVINPALDARPPRHTRPQVDHFDVQRYHQVLPVPSSASPAPPTPPPPPPPRLANIIVTPPDLACSASRQWVPLSHSLDLSARLVGFRLLALLSEPAALVLGLTLPVFSPAVGVFCALVERWRSFSCA